MRIKQDTYHGGVIFKTPENDFIVVQTKVVVGLRDYYVNNSILGSIQDEPVDNATYNVEETNMRQYFLYLLEDYCSLDKPVPIAKCFPEHYSLDWVLRSIMEYYGKS